MHEEMNPYQPPANLDKASTSPSRTSWLWNVWGFAMIWPFVANIVHRLALSLVLMQRGGWSVYMAITMPVYLVGWAVCIIAAVRYRASVPIRILRGVGSILVMFAFAQIARLFFNFVYAALH